MGRRLRSCQEVTCGIDVDEVRGRRLGRRQGKRGVWDEVQDDVWDDFGGDVEDDVVSDVWTTSGSMPRSIFEITYWADVPVWDNVVAENEGGVWCDIWDQVMRRHLGRCLGWRLGRGQGDAWVDVCDVGDDVWVDVWDDASGATSETTGAFSKTAYETTSVGGAWGDVGTTSE